MTNAADLPDRSRLDDFWSAITECHHDLPAVLHVIAERVVAALGDGCVVTTVSLDGRSLVPRAVTHEDPVVARAMRAALARGETRIGDGIAGTVAADRRPIVLNDLPPETIADTTPEQFLPFVRDHPMRALAIAPLVASGDLVGTLGSVRTSSAEPYTLAEIRLLEALAERAALAIADALGGPRSIDMADYEAIYRHNLDGVLITTPDGHVLACNPAACRILQLTEREIVHGGRDLLVVADDPRLQQMLDARALSGHARGELTVRRGDGSVFPADVATTIYATPDHGTRSVVIFRDVSSEVATRELVAARVAELEQVVDRDPLTGLHNRRGFAIAAEQAIAMADRQELTCYLVFVDVDDLKRTNDTEGHATGDAAIVAVAHAIAGATRDVDVVCRLGGDEFLALVVGVPDGEVDLVIERIRHELASDTGAPPGVTFSTGVTERPPLLEATLSELIDAADRDMYQNRVLRRLRRSAG